MAPCRCCASGALLRQLEQVVPRHHGEPVPRSRKAGSENKAQPLAVDTDGGVDVPLTIRYGILGAAIAAVLPSALIVILTLREAGKIIGERFTFIARTFVPGITGSLIMVVAIYAWYYASASFSPVLRLAVSVVLGTSVYVAYLWWARRELFYEIRELIGRK